MKQILILLTIVNYSLITHAQTAEDSVKATVNKMFSAMKNADGEMLKSVFTDSAILQTVSRDKAGKVKVTTDAVSEFVDFVSHEQKGNADERITIDVVKVDAALAIVWAPYKFYYKGVFSHCGVNSFQLVRINGEWKIQYTIDTRRKTGCE
jgi:hypothetical protein